MSYRYQSQMHIWLSYQSTLQFGPWVKEGVSVDYSPTLIGEWAGVWLPYMDFWTIFTPKASVWIVLGAGIIFLRQSTQKLLHNFNNKHVYTIEFWVYMNKKHKLRREKIQKNNWELEWLYIQLWTHKKITAKFHFTKLFGQTMCWQTILNS